jgi:hypothetical protein
MTFVRFGYVAMGVHCGIAPRRGRWRWRRQLQLFKFANSSDPAFITEKAADG